MDIEIEGPVDDLEALFVDEDDAMLGDAEAVRPSNHPLAC